MSVSVDPATNRITGGGHTYDANRDLAAMSMPTMTYNVSNRLVSATHSVSGTDKCWYGPWGHRVRAQVPLPGGSTRNHVTFYGAGGNP